MYCVLTKLTTEIKTAMMLVLLLSLCIVAPVGSQGTAVRNDDTCTALVVTGHGADSSAIPGGETQIEWTSYLVKSGDNLERIAGRFGLSVGILEILNPHIVDHLIYVGEQLRLILTDVPPFLDIHTKANTLLLLVGELVIKQYSISTGRGGEFATPLGEFVVTDIVWDPFDYEKQAPPGNPDNRFGAAWVSLNMPKFGIHGTNDPGQIGGSCTDGCIRMTNEDVSELALAVSIGMKVRVH